MHTAMVISPHADDAAAFCGGTLAKFAAEGWKVVLARVTDDCRDSVGLTVEEARKRNAEDLGRAAQALGLSEIVELGYETDCLADVSMVKLREKIVRLFRERRPYAVFSFDPYQLWEDNMDHVVVARAVHEAFWVSAFDLHHPEHFKNGVEPFSVCERWFFGRELPGANYAVDVTDYIGRKIDAFAAHKRMVDNMLNRFELQLKTWGRRAPLLSEARKEGARGLLEAFLTEQGKDAAARFKLGEGRLGEVFRLERFGPLEGLFQLFSEPLPGGDPVYRPGLDPKKD